jgi:phosphonate transport system substrate-binding protein
MKPMRPLPWTLRLLLVTGLIASTLVTPAASQDRKLRFGVGPLQPTPTETKKAYEPFFAYLAKQIDRDFDLVATTDWAGISVALANDQVDLAWMGPWGYILANNDSGVTAIATAKYDGKPIYYAIVVCKPGHGIKTWPDDAKGKRVSFADVGSTSGWLIPSAWFKTKGINPKEYFAYSDGATHAAIRDCRGGGAGGLRHGLRQESQRDDGIGQARQERDRDRLAIRSAPQ